jgi:hypothetical protein
MQCVTFFSRSDILHIICHARLRSVSPMRRRGWNARCVRRFLPEQLQQPIDGWGIHGLGDLGCDQRFDNVFSHDTMALHDERFQCMMAHKSDFAR